MKTESLVEGILRHMAEIKDMYKLALFINSDKYKPIRNRLQTPKAAIYDCVKEYSINKRSISESKALQIFDNAMEHHYIEVIGQPPAGHYVRIRAGRGHHLVAKKGHFYRSGLIDESLATYSNTQKFITGTVVGGLVVALAKFVVTWVYSVTR